MRIDRMPESEEKEVGLQVMQADIHMKGAQLGKVWADLFGLLSKYQAELMLKENQIEIAERHLETKKEQYEEMSPMHGLEEVAKVEERLQEKELQLSQCQIELSQMETMFKRVQIDLSTNMDMLDQTRTELLEKQTQNVSCQADMERLKADVSLKDEQIRVKDGLLKKIQQQLMKENAELKEQYLEEKSSHDAERMSHSQTKKLLEKLKRRGSRENASVIEIPDSPPIFDLSCEAANTLGLSTAMDHDSLLSSQRQSNCSSSDGRRMSASSLTNYRQSGTVDYSMSRTPSNSFSAPSSSVLSPSAVSTSMTSASRSTYMTPSPSQRLLPAKSYSEPRTRVSNSPSFSHPSNSDNSNNFQTSETQPVEHLLPDIKKDYSDQLSVREPSPVSGPIPSTSGSASQSGMEVSEGQGSDTSMDWAKRDMLYIQNLRKRVCRGVCTSEGPMATSRVIQRKISENATNTKALLEELERGGFGRLINVGKFADTGNSRRLVFFKPHPTVLTDQHPVLQTAGIPLSFYEQKYHVVEGLSHENKDMARRFHPQAELISDLLA
ncbi:uncharacterized protein LOC135488841 isoform X3 [Lineus longissimus]|uniref:uncharacterized protein LOC135488841 isoform X3 n=1 Tax=Lineus longissimus TaxID=88925 RepID=UPI00315CAB92